MPIIKLTQSFISNDLRCPEGKSRIEFCCADQPGLYVEVRTTSQGQGTFYWRYKDSTGKTCHQKIGRTSDISLADARKQAKTLKAEIELGADPRGEHKRQKAVLTYSEFFEDHFLPFVKLRLRSWDSYESIYRVHLKAEYGHVLINKITRKQIVDFHTSLKNSGLSAASCNHIGVKLMKRSLNHAIDMGFMESPNPVARVQQFQEDNKVENILDRDQLEKLLSILRTDQNRPVCLILLYLLSTGARLNEALSARWEHINRVHRVWRIPASNSKSKRVRVVPLNDSAMEVLSQLDTEGYFEHLFVNRQRSEKLGKEAPYTTITKVWDRIRNEAGIPHFRIHDARHLFASWLVSSGRPIFEVMTLLGHADVKTTQRYAHLSTKTLQDASNSASAIIRGAMLASVTAVPELPSGALQGDVLDVVPVALPELLQADVLQEAEVRLAA